MKLSSEERQTLLGPLVVGVLVGAFVAYAAVAFNSEFRLSGLPVSDLQFIGEAALGFVLSVVATVGFLGVLPIAIHRKRARGKGNA